MKTQIAYCSTLPLTAPTKEFRVLPAGSFRAIDGRPHALDGWHLDRDDAIQIIRLSDARSSDYVIDYEHQTLSAAKNGQAAPAAGWFKHLEWREGDGLYVIDARWTERATAMILAKEYRFISPVFTFDKSGRVLDVLHAALTNNPALDGLTELAAATAYAQQMDANHYPGLVCFSEVNGRRFLCSPSRLELHQKAEALSLNSPEVSYLEAVRLLESPNQK